MRSIHRSICLSLVVAALVSSRSAAASPEADLGTAENAYATLEYGAALTAADSVLAQKNLTHDVLTRATRVAGLAHAALGQAELAKQQFILMLEYDPDFKIDGRLGPRYMEPFAEARGYWQAQGRKAGMDVQVQIQYGQAGEFRVTTRDPLNIVKKISVGQRWAPRHQYTTTEVDGDRKGVEIPANPDASTRLEYYVRALDAKGNAVFETGTPDVPSTTLVTEPARTEPQKEKKSIFGSPVLYVVGGTILAAAAVGAYFAFRPTEYTTPTIGRAQLGLGCGAARCE